MRKELLRFSPFLLLICFSREAASYATIHNSNLSPGDLIGIWRLTGERSKNSGKNSALKEFTVCPPKKDKIQPNELKQGTFIRLSANGSFEQCASLDFDSEEKRDGEYEEKSEKEYSKNDMESIFGLRLMKGSWDYVDGKLILAADRPSDYDSDGIRKVHDTILEGEVVATTDKRLIDNPALSNATSKENQTVSEESVNPQRNDLDIYLSVPNGSVQIGRFVYPKRHPSFFEQPIFHPTPAGSFHLRQILGNLNARLTKDDEEIERFCREDFYGKRFFLTSRPLKDTPKGKMKWNRSLCRYVEVKPKVDPNENIDIRVMQIDFFSNNTFSTVQGGLMNEKTKILRGKWSIIGREKDHLWMQVSRFGFGRSVSGSVYSEGSLLTQDDSRSYWGSIKVVDDKTIDAEDGITSEEPVSQKKVLEVKGSVLFGWGLEPEPIGKFVMIEQTEEDDEDDDDDDDDNDDDEISFESVFE